MRPVRPTWTTVLAAGTALLAALAVPAGSAPQIHEMVISDPAQFTEHRGPNEAGVLAAYQIVLTATVAPSGLPTLVGAEQEGVRHALWHYPVSTAPDLYVHLRRVEPGSTGAWRIVAERGEARSGPVWTPVLAKPQEVPLVRALTVTGPGTEPRVTWQLPDLAQFDIDRIRVGVRGGKRLYERFMDQLYSSDDLPPTATAFVIPPGVLAPGERYIVEVRLEDLEGGVLENRSVTFSRPYTASR